MRSHIRCGSILHLSKMRRKWLCLPLLICLTACGTEVKPPDFIETGSMELQYAEQFSVSYYEGGYTKLSIADGTDYLIVPDGAMLPENTGDMVILQQPLTGLYVAATSAVDLFDGIGCLDAVEMVSTKDWALPHVQEALADESICYAGKYNAPDYELLVERGCGLAVESTMIYHTPETKEQLEQLGIPVLTERSSYESHPLGRMEWVKVYGLLLGKTDEAETFFNEQAARFDAVAADTEDAEQKTVAFFSVSPNGYINIRKPGDYISELISHAGGRYAFTAEGLEVDDNALSTMNIQTEVFYETAKDADIFIYNSAIEGEITTMEQLLDKCPVLAGCKAVQEGNVWCTGQNVFQQTSGAADLLCDLHAVITGTEDALTFLHKVE